MMLGWEGGEISGLLSFFLGFKLDTAIVHADTTEESCARCRHLTCQDRYF